MNACSRSAMMSSDASMPIEMRTRLSPMPSRWRIFGGNFAVRRHGRIEHHGVHVAQRGRAHDHLQRFHEAEHFRAAGVLQFERDHRAGQIFREQARDGGGVGMRGIAGEVDALDARMRRRATTRLCRRSRTDAPCAEPWS